jgi:sugar phosphate isomerase/epimerase
MKTSSRRQFLAICGAAASARPARAADAPAGFRLCLNMATLRGYRLGIVEMVDAAGKAGYHAIEPWLDSLTAYTAQGGSLADLRKRIADFGMTVESAIAFPQWVVDDPAKRAAGMEQAAREMEMVARIGGTRIAAPPAGANTAPEIPLAAVADRYRALLELGGRTGVTPELEFWGPSSNLSKLSQAMDVAIQVNHPKACVLADIFHLYKGGSGFAGLRLVAAEALPVLHMNDYPAQPPRETIADRDRVYPGDGVAPLKQLLADLRRVNPNLVLSLEVFNPTYWKTDALDTARTGLSKMKTIVG